mgnify:FL=1
MHYTRTEGQANKVSENKSLTANIIDVCCEASMTILALCTNNKQNWKKCQVNEHPHLDTINSTPVLHELRHEKDLTKPESQQLINGLFRNVQSDHLE